VVDLDIGERMKKKICIALAIVLVAFLVLEFWPWGAREDRFELTITIHETTINQGEDFTVYVEFRNLSWRRYWVSHGHPMMGVYIIGEEPDGGLVQVWVRETSVLGRNQTRRKTIIMGSHFEPGEFQLRAAARFSLVWRSSEVIDVRSVETINVSVLESSGN